MCLLYCILASLSTTLRRIGLCHELDWTYDSGSLGLSCLKLLQWNALELPFVQSLWSLDTWDSTSWHLLEWCN